MKLNQLEALIAIADRQGIAGAADKLNVSQPAITKSLSSLEQELGVALLDRSGYRLKLSVFGEALLLRARAISAEVSKAREDIAMLRDQKQHMIRFNGTPGTMPILIPESIKKARKVIPHLNIEFIGEINSGPAIKYKELAEGLYDLLIYTFDADHETYNYDFAYEPLLEVRVLVLANKNHPATHLSQPSLDDLSHFEWLFPSGKDTLPYKTIRQAFLNANATFPESVLPLPTRQMIFSFLKDSDYLAFVPYHPAIADRELEEFTVIDVDCVPFGWWLYIFNRKSTVLSEGMTTFIESMKTVVRDAESNK